MKRNLLVMGLLACSFGAFAQFTANRLVVSQYGDGVAPLSTTTVPVFLKEYNVVAGASTYSLAMPIVAVPSANYPLTGLPTGSNEGLITLSPNGTFLSVFGYGVAPNETPSATNIRTIGLVKADGSVNTTTNLPGSASVANPRCAITVDGTGFWFVSSGGGMRYTPFASSAATVGVNSSPLGSMRSVNIFNGQLYEITNSNSAGAYHIGTVTAAASGNKLPISSEVNNANTAPVALPGLEGSATVAPTVPNQIVLLKSTPGAGNPDLIYIANDGTGLIEKWILSSGTWIPKGTVTATTELNALSVKGITGRVVGTTAYVYANTASSLIAITDALPATSTISDVLNAPVILATAPTNTIFKGVAFTPGTDPATVTTLPIKLSSFTGKSVLNGAQLSWTTTSEKDNNHFDVLRSGDGQFFGKIGEIKGSGNSDVKINYSFTDKNALAGTNYYKLNQVDNDGKSLEFGPVAVNTSGNTSEMYVTANKESGELNVNITSNVIGKATLKVFDTTGKLVIAENVTLQEGNNQFKLNTKNTITGLHIINLIADGLNLTKKFIVQ